VKKILVIQTAFIGDVILATAVLEELHRSNADATIDVLVRKGNESLFDGHPFLRNVLVWDKKQNKYAHLFNLLRTIRSEQYDAVINLQRYTASAFLTAFSKSKQRIGFASNALAVFYTHKKAHRLGQHGEANWQHEVQRCLSLIAHMSPNAAALPRLYPRDSDKAYVESYCSAPFITISPASVWFTKQTPLHIWKSLVERCDGMKVFLLGGPGDKTLCEELAKGFSHVQVLSGQLSLLQSAALMARARMNFTNDSAPLHLCSAMNAPVTAVFCSTIPEFGFGPLSDNRAIIQSTEWPECKPCGIHGRAQCPKGHFQCGEIDVNQLVKRVN
jgi:heptosyltransferase-2